MYGRADQCDGHPARTSRALECCAPLSRFVRPHGQGLGERLCSGRVVVDDENRQLLVAGSALGYTHVRRDLQAQQEPEPAALAGVLSNPIRPPMTHDLLGDGHSQPWPPSCGSLIRRLGESREHVVCAIGIRCVRPLDLNLDPFLAARPLSTRSTTSPHRELDRVRSRLSRICRADTAPPARARRAVDARPFRVFAAARTA